MLDKTKILPIILDALKSGAEENIEANLGGLGDTVVEKASVIATNIKSLCENYDYFQSSDFLKRVEGQSEFYVNFVKQSFNQAHEDRLIEAIRNIEHSDTIFDLIQSDQKQHVNAIRDNLAQIYKMESPVTAL